jgi:hypothetical protein
MPRSPDVRGCLPGIRSLDADRASPSWLRLSSHAGSRGTGNPSTTTQSGRHRTGMGQASDRHSSRVRSPFGHQTGLPMPRSPDVRGCLPGIRSLDADRASPSWLRLSSHAGSRGTGNPSTTAPLRDVPSPNTPRSGGPRPPVRATLGVARNGPSENGQDARVSRVHGKRAGCPCFAEAARPKSRGLEDRGSPVRATLGVARDGPSENGQDARVSRVVRRSASADTRPRGGRGRGGRSPPAGRG